MPRTQAARLIASQDDVFGVLRAAVGHAKDVLHTDAGFAALAFKPNEFHITQASGTTSARFESIVIPANIGLGGRVALLRRPMAVHDYLTDPRITKDFTDIVVGDERLRGIACVPVQGPTQVEALLYTAVRGQGFLSGVALDTLQWIGEYAGIAIQQIRSRERERELAILRERQLLATKLHDSVAQMLFTIGIEARRSLHERDSDALAAALTEIEAIAGRARSELRRTLTTLTEAPQTVALDVILEAEARLFDRNSEFHVQITRSGVPRPVSELSQDLVADTVREGLRNVAKYAVGAKLVVVHLSYGSDDVRAVIQDDGKRRPEGRQAPDEPATTASGLGLLRRRATQLGGSLDVQFCDDADAGEESGTTIRLTLPATRFGAAV